MSGTQSRWPDPPGQVAYAGLAGEYVRVTSPHTEADPVALLAQFLAAVGNIVGRGPHFTAERDRHGPNLFVVLVGETAKGRKGSSWGQVVDVVRQIDRAWHEHRIQSGLSSGEGLIWAVRDPITRREPVRKDGHVQRYENVEVDAGVSDKRLIVIEPEFASILRVLERDGNTLSAHIRQAWDTGTMRVLTKNSPATATGAHISVVGHITTDELRRYLGRTEAGNGFANRFAWLCVRRHRVLPDGGSLEAADLEALVRELRTAVEHARGLTDAPLRRDEEARDLWHDVYPELSAGRPGLLGAVTSRAEAQVMRIALIYALLDRARAIARPHLEAALALWDYAEASARFIFGDALGDPVADAILAALRGAPDGLSRLEISRDVFGRHRDASDIDRALADLSARGLAMSERVATAGRPAVRWQAVENGAKKANEAKEAQHLPSLRSLSSRSSDDLGDLRSGRE